MGNIVGAATALNRTDRDKRQKAIGGQCLAETFPTVLSCSRQGCGIGHSAMTPHHSRKRSLSLRPTKEGVSLFSGDNKILVVPHGRSDATLRKQYKSEKDDARSL